MCLCHCVRVWVGTCVPSNVCVFVCNGEFGLSHSGRTIWGQVDLHIEHFTITKQCGAYWTVFPCPHHRSPGCQRGQPDKTAEAWIKG